MIGIALFFVFFILLMTMIQIGWMSMYKDMIDNKLDFIQTLVLEERKDRKFEKAKEVFDDLDIKYKIVEKDGGKYIELVD